MRSERYVLKEHGSTTLKGSSNTIRTEAKEKHVGLGFLNVSTCFRGNGSIHLHELHVWADHSTNNASVCVVCVTQVVAQYAPTFGADLFW